MSDCGCRWDGNLDGRLLRCHAHSKRHKLERAARKQAERVYQAILARGSVVECCVLCNAQMDICTTCHGCASENPPTYTPDEVKSSNE